MIPQTFQEEQNVSFQKLKAIKALKKAKEIEQNRLKQGAKYIRLSRKTVILKNNGNPDTTN